ncbi:MAG TPA: energy transducer TonB [Steroidobacteraceae bacterium]|nr:energy transducer TonB [Steroidobacteraceae bacterium]
MRVRAHAEDEVIAAPTVVTTVVELPRTLPDDRLLAEQKKPDVLQLQRLAPEKLDVKVQEIEIELPESLVTTEVAPPPASASAPVTAEADAGAAGNASSSSGRSGDGDGLVLLERVLPIYPAAASRRGEQGLTDVVLHVTESGRVDQVKVLNSSGSKDLDEAAERAFRKWRFARMPAGSAPAGKWLRTGHRFIMYRFAYSRLDPGAAESVYLQRMQPAPGVEEVATEGSQKALLSFIATVRNGVFAVPRGVSASGVSGLRAALQQWGAVQSVQFDGIAGSSRWLRFGAGASDHIRRAVEVSWNMFRVRHDNGISNWLIATDRDGELWAASAGQAAGT